MSVCLWRRLLPLFVVLALVPIAGYAQFADETQGLFDVSPSTVNRNTNQVIIEFKEDQIIEETEVDVGDNSEVVCCQLPEEERASSDACLDITCPDSQ